MNDRQLSELISQSLSGLLSEQQQFELNEALKRSPISQRYAELATRIHQSAAEQVHVEREDQPRQLASDPNERLSELSKERLRRSVREAQTSLIEDAETYRPLLVAQTPSEYLTKQTEQPGRLRGSSESSPSTTETRESQELALRTSGIRLCERLNAKIQHLQTTARLVCKLTQDSLAGELVTSSATPLSSKGPRETVLTMEQLAHVLFAMVAVDPDISTLSIAKCQDLTFCELLRVQRTPRDASVIEIVEGQHLQRGAVSDYHRAIINSTTEGAQADVDSSIAGWPRLRIGCSLAGSGVGELGKVDSQTGSAWGLAFIELDLSRALRTATAFNNLNEVAWIVDEQRRALCCSSETSDAKLSSLTFPSESWKAIAEDVRRYGEFGNVVQGIWGARLASGTPRCELYLIMLGARDG